MYTIKCVVGCSCHRHDNSCMTTPEVRNRAALARMASSPEGGLSCGYRYVNGAKGHPLYVKGQVLFEHRKVLYDKIGPGPHECHWNHAYDCGKTALEWGGIGGIVVDHLDDTRINNEPENLVAACNSCNMRRGRELAALYSLIKNGVVTTQFVLEKFHGS